MLLNFDRCRALAVEAGNDVIVVSQHSKRSHHIVVRDNQTRQEYALCSEDDALSVQIFGRMGACVSVALTLTDDRRIYFERREITT